MNSEKRKTRILYIHYCRRCCYCCKSHTRIVLGFPMGGRYRSCHIWIFQAFYTFWSGRQMQVMNYMRSTRGLAHGHATYTVICNVLCILQREICSPRNAPFCPFSSEIFTHFLVLNSHARRLCARKWSFQPRHRHFLSIFRAENLGRGVPMSLLWSILWKSLWV